VSDLHFTQSAANAPAPDDVSERVSNEKLQQLGRSLLSALFMLIRSVKMYEPDNSVFEKPFSQLSDTITHIIQRDGRLELLGVKQSFYINGTLIKVDLASLDNIKQLLAELRARDVTGFSCSRPPSLPELKNLIAIFAHEQSETIDEEGLASKRLVTLKLAQWSKLKDRLDDTKDETEAKLDRKKYALLCYARAVVFTQKYLESVQHGEPLNTAKALRIIQDFIDVVSEQRVHFLGLTTTRVDAQYLPFHHVNTCLLSLVFGSELGLTKPQLRDLGYIALFHDSGMSSVSDSVLAQTGQLDADAKAAIAKSPIVAAKNILKEKSFNRATLLRLVATVEHKADFGAAVRDAVGNIEMIIPKAKLGLYARVISICATFDALTSRRAFRDAYSPDIALMLMWTELRHRFDPQLLQVFMRVMAIAPVRVLTKRQQSLHFRVT
jgi:HD-GYP domain-containing protein (c-di-GMP phosphodiesterase class II)